MSFPSRPSLRRRSHASAASARVRLVFMSSLLVCGEQFHLKLWSEFRVPVHSVVALRPLFDAIAVVVVTLTMVPACRGTAPASVPTSTAAPRAVVVADRQHARDFVREDGDRLGFATAGQFFLGG